MKIWKLSSPLPNICSEISGSFNVSQVTAQILVNRGLKDPEEIKRFLNPQLSFLSQPTEIPNIVKACERVDLAKQRKEKVLVFGDYDVDGVTGTAIILETLKFLGIEASYYIPYRYREGYSMNVEAIKKIKESGTDLIITVDCGISNHKEIEYANKLGMDVVVTDHHTPPKSLPPAYAIVNPKLISGSHPAKHLSGAGVAFKFAWQIFKTFGIKDQKFLVDMLDLAGLGTIADIVPLTFENRIFAFQGITLLNSRKRLGIKHLIEAARLKRKINLKHINFIISPRLNAAGRLEHASLSVKLLTTKDPSLASEIAQKLNKINTKRQDLGSSVREEAGKSLNMETAKDNKIIILYGQDWHPGVIGIVASQLVDRYYRPTVIIGLDGSSGRGSARSLDGVNIYELLESCQDLFLNFGGHEGAAGFEIAKDKLEEFTARLKKKADESIKTEDLIPKLKIDMQLPLSHVSLTLVREIEKLSPFGEGNPEPLFLTSSLKLLGMKRVGKDKHLKLRLSDGRINIDAIGFRMGHIHDRLKLNDNYHIVYKLTTEEWDGFELVQFNLVDIKEARQNEVKE
jgi:single-stranded-DNA-specific exonuclease